MGTNMIASVLFTPVPYWYGVSVSGRFRPHGNRFRARPATSRASAGPDAPLRGGPARRIAWRSTRKMAAAALGARPGKGSPDRISPAGTNLWKAPFGPSGRAVHASPPFLGQRKERPSQLVIVRGDGSLAEARLHGRSHGIQQSIELSFADLTLRVHGDNTHRNHP